jgi:hypothetical protein
MQVSSTPPSLPFSPEAEIVTPCLELGRPSGAIASRRLVAEPFQLWHPAAPLERQPAANPTSLCRSPPHSPSILLLPLAYLPPSPSLPPLASTESRNTVTTVHPILGCNVYISFRRSVGRLLCGWAALHAIPTPAHGRLPAEHPASQELRVVVEEFETVGKSSAKPLEAGCCCRSDSPQSISSELRLWRCGMATLLWL